MAVRTLTVECPMCKGELIVDADTGEVLSHKEYKKEVKSFDEFLKSQKNRAAELDALFAAGKEKDKQRASIAEKKFEAAKQNKDLKDPPPTINWD